MPTWRDLPDLAVRTSGGSVIAANDEMFGEKENLIKPGDPAFQPRTFGNRGQIVDGWETRRRRDHGHDWAVVRLGMPGIVHGIVVDTTWFTGNYPPECSIDAAGVDPLGEASTAQVDEPAWEEIVARSPVEGNTRATFDVEHPRLVTHVRLRQYPDGGIARLRVHGQPVGDPRWVAGRSFDLAALEHGAAIADCSDTFYSSPANLLIPGPARVMGEGWETARRRDQGHDWVVIDLATDAVVGRLEIDTTCFVGNAPGAAVVSALQPEPAQLMPRVRLQPDTANRFLLDSDRDVAQLRLDIHPDGGLARFRAIGAPTPSGRAAMFLRWYDLLPTPWAVAALAGWGGASEQWAKGLAAGRPYGSAKALAAARVSGDGPDAAAWAALTGLPA